MSEKPTSLARCQGITASGQRCERVVGASQTHCYSHDESRAEERKANASKAAKSKLATEVLVVREEIREIMDDIREGDIDRGDGAVLLQGAGLLLRSIAEGRKQAEYDEIRHEMEELRAMFEAQQQAKRGDKPWATWTS